MKRVYLSLLAIVAATAWAWASSTVTLLNTEYTVDTLFHNQVGPGTTQTSLWLRAGTSQLRVFYCTMDMTNPYLSLAGVCATDKLAGNEKISAMAERKSEPGKRYFIGINADFFVTSGTTVRGVSRVGTPVGSTVVDGEIYRARNNATLYKNFIVDTQGQFYVNPFFFGGTVTAPDGSVATLGGINTYANENAASNKNKITIYNDLYYGSTNETGAGCEVQARLADGERFETAAPFHMVITSDTSTVGDMTIPDSAYVIHGHGTAATLVQELRPGDTIVVSPTWTYNGVSVEPYQIISGNPKILEGGVRLDSEGDRGDAADLHPRSAVGYGNDGHTVYFMVVDGRSTLSRGVRTSELADIMRYAGATDAMNVDGGGSAVLYTSTLGIRNEPSDGTERADGNGFYCVSSAPDDDTIATIRFIDFNLNIPQYGVYTPHYYGYNRYGMLIDTDVQGVTLFTPDSLGMTLGDSTFYATGSGSGVLTASYNGVTATLPVSITSSVDAINIPLDSVINDTFRQWPVDVTCTVGENTMSIYPQALTWSSSDTSVVIIGEHTGVLCGVRDGEAWVTGAIQQAADTLRVIVERPTAHVMPVDPSPDVDTWKVTQTGGKAVALTATGDGLQYVYTGASSRAPKIVFAKALRLWSLPDTLRLRLNPGDAPVKTVVLGLRPAGGNIHYHTITPDSLPAGVETVLDLPTVAWMDTASLGNYPITLSSIQLNMGASTSGQQYTVLLAGLETVYRAIAPTAAEPPLQGDVNGDGEVTIADVNAIIDLILSGGYTTPADVNGDGEVTIADVNTVIDLILEATTT